MKDKCIFYSKSWNVSLEIIKHGSNHAIKRGKNRRKWIIVIWSWHWRNSSFISLFLFIFFRFLFMKLFNQLISFIFSSHMDGYFTVPGVGKQRKKHEERNEDKEWCWWWRWKFRRHSCDAINNNQTWLFTFYFLEITWFFTEIKRALFKVDYVLQQKFFFLFCLSL